MREISDYSDACGWREGGAATPLHGEGEGAVDADAREPQSPADIGLQATLVLLEEIKQGGVVDYTHQVLSICSMLAWQQRGNSISIKARGVLHAKDLK
ncbi:hypothetical protein AXG93_4620s1610 [Marchantia polymorpha subsp. ruderalis]|uniref:Uncharacterized protein n=1 Tax=Marchantia polymorpha subsp. ruderalis TaxID=1480154 RepID=A0A176VZI9_MARPO|nr:hypothetical protein AXG93_4620s1610 [Marchantia polymorpha subsp. ruderalis]